MQNACLIVCNLVNQNRNAVGHAEGFQFLNFSDELRRKKCEEKTILLEAPWTFSTAAR
jgi:hypothetical protein